MGSQYHVNWLSIFSPPFKIKTPREVKTCLIATLKLKEHAQ